MKLPRWCNASCISVEKAEIERRVYICMRHGREREKESEEEQTSAEQGDERGESEMRKRERHCRADSELDLNPGQGERMIVGSRRKEKGGGERARPRKLLSISSSRDRLHFLPRPLRDEIVSSSAFPTYAFATCQTVIVLLPCQGRPSRSGYGKSRLNDQSENVRETLKSTSSSAIPRPTVAVLVLKISIT